MDTVQSMKIFVRVAQRSGFAAAARDLRLSPAAVTKHVAGLEQHLGARLFDRTTRSVSLTEPGRAYFERCLQCLQAIEDAETSVRQFTRAPRGHLRVTAPIDLQHDVPPVIARFMAEHPAVTVDLQLSNRPLDLVDEGIDVAVRVGSPSLSGDHIARRLAPLRVGVVGAPAYLQAHGRPRKPQDLARHKSLVFVEPRPRLSWTFVRGTKKVEVTVQPSFTTNSGTALLSAAAAGAGITLAPSFNLRPFAQSGALELLLTDWQVAPDLQLYAVYPHRRFVSPNVALFVQMLRDAFGGGRADPFWPR